MMRRLSDWIRETFAILMWCVGFPLALLITITFPFWFFVLWIFCGVMACMQVR
jgi:type IV secretory pathway TrbD component